MAVVVKGKRSKRTPFVLEDPDGNQHEFSVRGIPGWSFMEFFAQTQLGSSDDPSEAQIMQEAKQNALAIELFEDAIGDPQMFAEFRKFVRNPDNGFGATEIMELLMLLAAEVAKRPTEPSTPSRSGRTKSGTGSTDSASSEELTSTA